MKLALTPLLMLAGCSQSPEAANTAAPANDAAAATPAKMIAAPEQTSPTKSYADATAAYNSFARAAAGLGKEKASSAALKRYAELVFKEQSQFGMEFKIASAKVSGLLPNPTLSAEQQEGLETLQQAGGAAFDRAFLAQQIAAHSKMLPVQQAFAASREDEALTAFADRYSRWVQRHLRLAKDI
jgi:putative membrane protein